MKKLVKRFKRALFAFFKEELLKEFGPTETVQFLEFRSEFKTVILNVEIDKELKPRTGEYEIMLKNAKRKLFNELHPFITIDSIPLLHPEYMDRRKLCLQLMVARK
jgi:hypothetical protein